MAVHTLPYRDVFSNGARPYLALHVPGLNGAAGDIPGLIDSGADKTSLPSGFASLMGYTAAELEPVSGMRSRTSLVSADAECAVDVTPAGDRRSYGYRSKTALISGADGQLSACAATYSASAKTTVAMP